MRGEKGSGSNEQNQHSLGTPSLSAAYIGRRERQTTRHARAALIMCAASRIFWRCRVAFVHELVIVVGAGRFGAAKASRIWAWRSIGGACAGA